MAKTTAIAWAHHTHNLWWGCEEVSPACDHCYARTLATRYGFDVWGLDKGRRFFKEPHYNEPIGWNAAAERAGERKRVFCGSMMDIAEQHPDPQVNALMNAARLDYFRRIVSQTPWLDHLLLTKRPANYRTILPESWVRYGCPSNVWLGTTVENQQWLDVRVPYLLDVPARVHWISYEPALGPLDFTHDTEIGPLSFLRSVDVGEGPSTHVNWLIAGGESGHHFREASLDWYRQARTQCQASSVPFFFKQHSAVYPKLQGDFLDGRQWHDVPRAAA